LDPYSHIRIRKLKIWTSPWVILIYVNGAYYATNTKKNVFFKLFVFHLLLDLRRTNTRPEWGRGSPSSGLRPRPPTIPGNLNRIPHALLVNDIHAPLYKKNVMT
jgi:hypothetical protein